LPSESRACEGRKEESKEGLRNEGTKQEQNVQSRISYFKIHRRIALPSVTSGFVEY
jgi:hypothetical protein